jgi:adenylylsulfate kinase
MEGWAVWITGLPGSGKSTIAEALAKRLEKSGIQFQTLSVDMLRKTVTPKPTYSEEERRIVYDTLVHVASLLTKNSVNVLIDATGNRRMYRNAARKKISRFMEAYVRCPLNECVTREMKRQITFKAPRGIYAKAARKASLTVPGIGVPYEKPLRPEVVVDSQRLTPNQSAEKIFRKVEREFGQRQSRSGGQQ